MNRDQPENTLDEIKARISDHLSRLYPDENIGVIADEIISIMMFNNDISETRSHVNLWDESDIVTITYGDSIKRENELPLETLQNFLSRHLSIIYLGVGES